MYTLGERIQEYGVRISSFYLFQLNNSTSQHLNLLVFPSSPGAATWHGGLSSQLIDHLFPLTDDILYKGDCQNTDEKNHRHGGSIPKPVFQKSLLVEFQHHHRRGMCRTATGQNKDLVKHLKSQDGVVDEYKGGGWHQKGEGDSEKTGKGTSAIDSSGFIVDIGDGL